jgi:hypothetical protein
MTDSSLFMIPMICMILGLASAADCPFGVRFVPGGALAEHPREPLFQLLFNTDQIVPATVTLNATKLNCSAQQVTSGGLSTAIHSCKVTHLSQEHGLVQYSIEVDGCPSRDLEGLFFRGNFDGPQKFVVLGEWGL